MTEDQLQSQFYQHVWNNYPQLRRCIWAVPNGGSRHFLEAAKLKATGMLAGVWDLHVFYRGHFYIIETKIGDNQLTRDRIVNGKKVYGQKEWGELMVSNGAESFVYRSLEEGIRIIEYIINKHI